MSFKVSDLKGSLSKSSVAHSSHYEVIIFPTRGNQGIGSLLSNIFGGSSTVGKIFGTNVEDLAIRAESVSMPGRTIQSTTYRDYGAVREIGYAPLYTPITVNFLCSSDLRERQFFTSWQDLIVGNHRSLTTQATYNTFNAGYYDNYVSTIEIRQYDQAGDIKFRCELREAYPKSVGEISYSYVNEELVRCAVQFQYRYFVEKSSQELFQDIVNIL